VPAPLSFDGHLLRVAGIALPAAFSQQTRRCGPKNRPGRLHSGSRHANIAPINKKQHPLPTRAPVIDASLEASEPAIQSSSKPQPSG